MEPDAQPYLPADSRHQSQAAAAIFTHLNLAVVGGFLPPDVPLDQPLPDPAYPKPYHDDIFVHAQRRMDERDAENRHGGNFFLIVEPYKPTFITQPSAPSAPSEVIHQKPSSRSSLRRSVMSAFSELNKTPISARRPASRVGPGSYEGVVSKLADSVSPRVCLHKFRTKTALRLGYGGLGPGRYTVDDSAIRPRAPSALMFRPHHDLKNTEIARLINKECQIGPGSYDVRDPRHWRSSTAAIANPTSAFQNTTTAYEQQDRPGPGTYTVHDEQVRTRPPSATFSRAKLRSVFDLGNDDPGPGAYNLPDTMRDPSNTRAGTFGTASRFVGGGRVYQRIKEFHFKKAKPKALPEAATQPPAINERDRTPPSHETSNVTSKSESKIRPKSISKVMREERERKKDAWRAKLLALDITALALDAQTEYRPIEEQRKRIQTRWLQLMPLASRTVWFANLLQTYRIHREVIVRAKSAVLRIQRWFRCICAARRLREIRRLEHVFGRILLRKFRARQFRRIAARKHQAAEIIKVMLIFEKRKLLKGVKTFRHKVIRLQNWWKRHVRQCDAILAVFEEQWIHLEEKIMTMYAEEEVKHTMTKAAKHTKASARRQTTAEIREEIAVPRTAAKDRRSVLGPLVKERYCAWIAARRKWDGHGPEPWVKVILPPLQILDFIKASQDSIPEEIVPKVVKLKLQKFIRRLVQQHSQ